MDTFIQINMSLLFQDLSCEFTSTLIVGCIYENVYQVIGQFVNGHTINESEVFIDNICMQCKISVLAVSDYKILRYKTNFIMYFTE